MKIGYAVKNYPAVRNIIDKASGHRYVQAHDVNRQVFKAARLFEKIAGKRFDATFNAQFTFSDFDFNKVDVLHLFNAVSFGRTPWVTTFETIVPRFGQTRHCHHGPECHYDNLGQSEAVKRAVRALSGKSCKRIIALSGCNLNMQIDFIKNCFPDDYEAINRKICVMHPPQQLLVQNCRDKNDEQLRLMIVGNAFVRKGGREIIEVARAFRKQSSRDVRLIIVSSLVIDDYATRETRADIDAIRQIIRQNTAWITHYPQLPNDQVIALMKDSHVGLLPTYADTYGFSVLEFQAAGCPVVTTDVRALPEINNDDVGWVINVPKNRLGEATYDSVEGRSMIGAAIRNGLMSAFEDIESDQDRLRSKSMASLARIRWDHDPVRFSDRLSEIYRAAAN